MSTPTMGVVGKGCPSATEHNTGEALTLAANEKMATPCSSCVSAQTSIYDNNFNLTARISVLSGAVYLLGEKQNMSINGAGNTHIHNGELLGAQPASRTRGRGTSMSRKLVAGFASFALMLGIGFIGEWNHTAIPQAEAASLVGGQPVTQGVKPNWQPLLNYDAVWLNGGLTQDATYWTADVSPSGTIGNQVNIVGKQYNWADDMNTFNAAPVLAVKRVATKTIDGFTPPGVPAGSTTTSLSTNNWQTTASARFGGKQNNPDGELSLYTWDNGGGDRVGGLICDNSAAGYPSSGYTPILRFTNNDPTIYWACMPSAGRNNGGFNSQGQSTTTIGSGNSWGGEADQYTGNIYISTALGGAIDTTSPTSSSAKDANSGTTVIFTVWNPQTGMYTVSGSIQPGDWIQGMPTVPQERIAVYQNVNGSGNASPEASADFVTDADGNIYIYIGNSVPGGNNNGGWNAKIVRVEPARNAAGDIVQGSASNPWRYYVVSKVWKDPAYPTLDWNDAGSIWGNAFINGQMLLTATAGPSNLGLASSVTPATGKSVGRTLLVKIDPLTNLARPVWSTSNIDGWPTNTTHDSASPQGAQVISGHLYNDVDGDGVLPTDASGIITAPGIYNQSVGLYDANGKLLAIHQTDTSGRYDFIVSGKEDTVYYVRPIQVQIPQSDGTMVNAAQTWALGSQEDGMNAAGATVTNTVGVQCYNATGGWVTQEVEIGAKCYGALNPASADPAVGAVGSTSDPATWLTYAKAELHTTQQVPTADFAFTTYGSYGDSTAGPIAANVPAHINTDPATSVWFGENPGAYSGAVTDNSHATDDGVTITSYDQVAIPLQGATLAATGRYTIAASLSGGGTSDAHAAGWTSGAGSTTWNASPIAWQPTISGETATGTFQFQPNGAVSGTPIVQFRAQVSTATITQPSNTSGQYYSTEAATGGPNWTTPGEIEDYTFTVADAVYRPAVKTTSGSATFTVAGQPLAGNSAAFTLGSATVVSANSTQTITADAPNSTWKLVSATVKRTFDGQVLDPTAVIVTKVSDTQTTVSWPVDLGDDVRVELVYGKAPDPNTSKLSIDPNTTTVGGTLTATATIKDADGNLLGGQVVNFTNASDAVVINPASCTTNETTGSCSVTITSDVAGTYTDEISATVGVGSSAVGMTGSPKTVIFTPAKGDPNKSSLALTPAKPLEVGTAAENTFTATTLVKDALNNTVPNQEVRYAVTNPDGSAVSSQTKLSSDHCNTADITGTCDVKLTSTKPGTYLIIATIQDPDDPDQWAPVQGSSATVVYVPKEVCMVEKGCAPQPGVTNVTHVQVTKDNARNDGQDTDEITAYTYDEWGNEVSAEVQISTTDAALKLAGTGKITTSATTGQGTLTATSLVGGVPHQATASVDGTNLGEEHGSPLTLNFTSLPALPDHSTLSLDSTQQEVGTVVTATVTTLDEDDKPVSGTKVNFAMDGPTYATFTNGVATCTTGSEGTCTVTFTDAKAETVSVHARLSSASTVDITGSPASTTFKPGKVCVPSATVTCSEDPTKQTRAEVNPNGAQADGTDTDGIIVYAFDKGGNPVAVTFTLVSLDQAVLASTSVDTNATSGQGSTTATSTSPTTQRVQVSVDATLLPMVNLVYTDTTPPPTPTISSTNSSWTLSPTTTATTGTVPVANGNSTGQDYWTGVATIRDQNNAPMSNVDASTIVFTPSSADVRMTSVTNTGNGTYSVTFSSTKAANPTVSVKVGGGAKIGATSGQDTPTDLAIPFQAGPLCIPTASQECAYTYAEVNPNGAIANGMDTDRVNVYSADKDGNPVTATFILTSTDAQVSLSQTIITTPAASGTGSATGTSNTAGDHPVSVTINGVTMPKSPLTLSYVAAPANPPVTGNSTLELDRTSQETGKNVTATVTARDADNDPVAGTIVVVSVNQSATVGPLGQKTYSCRTDSEGVCTVTLTDTIPEQVTVHATLNQGGNAVDILGSPTTVTFTNVPCIPMACTPDPDVPDSHRTRVEVDPQNQPVTTGTDVATVYVFDQLGYPVSGATIASTTTDSALSIGGNIPATNAQGESRISYTSTIAGGHQAVVTINGTPVAYLPQNATQIDPSKSSPVTLNFVAAQTGPSVTTSTLDVDRTTQVAGATVTATVTARDENNHTVANASMVVSVNGSAVAGPQGQKAYTCTTDAEGVCTVAITDKVAEQVTIHATVNATDIVGSPKTVTFTDAGPCVAPCQPGDDVPNDRRTRVEVTTDNMAYGSGTDVATVYVFDEYGNPCEGATIASTTSDPALSIGASIAKSNAQGESTVSYTSTAPGEHEAAVTINGVPVGFIPQGSTQVEPSKSSPIVVHFVDATAPAAPTVTTPKPGSQINDPTPDVVGTAEPGSTVTVKDKDSGITACTATADESGAYACTSEELGDGPHTLAVTATDPSGNVSPATNVPILVDTIAPQPPAIDKANGTEISGRAEPGSIITVTVPGVADPVTTTADGNGSWRITTPAGAQDGTVRATASDPAGNTSPEVTAPLDVTPPAKPTIDVANGTEISGTAEPGSTVTVVVPGVTNPVKVVVGEDGTWLAPTPQGATDGVLTVTATDPAGNTSPQVTRQLDVTPPAAPVVNATSTQIYGTAEAGSTLTITVPGVANPVTTTADASGHWSIPTPAGAHNGTVSATATDAAGNVSDPGTAELIGVGPAVPAPIINVANATKVAGNPGSTTSGKTITVTFPDGQVKTTTAAGDGSWTIPTPATMGSGDVTATATDPTTRVMSAPATARLDTDVPGAPRVDVANANEVSGGPGAAEPGSTVTVTFPDGTKETTVVDPDGSYRVDTPANMPDGGTVTVTVTDPAGNVSDPTQHGLDTEAPGKPTIEVANATKVSGTAEPGSTVTVTFPDGTKQQTTADKDGAYSVATPQGMPDGGKVTVVATDPAGNVSGQAQKDLDTQAPDAPVIDRADATEISGTAEPGSTVTVKVPGVDTPITIVVGGDGKWMIATPAGATDGTVRATATDPAGNVSGEATAQIDVTAPSVPVVNPSNGSEVTGTADPGSVISITDENGNNVKCKNADGTTSDAVTVDADGNFSCVPNKTLEPGTSITVVAKDASGIDSDPVTVKIGNVSVEVAYAERHTLESQVVTGYRFNSGEEVCLVVHSDPLDLGCQVADDQGKVTFTFQVPQTFDASVHTVTVSGKSSQLSASTSFTVVDTVLVKTGGTASASGTSAYGVYGVLALVAIAAGVGLGVRHLKLR